MYVEYKCLKCGKEGHEYEDLSAVPYMKCTCGTPMVMKGNEED